MSESNKILTVSYGTFSCTLEGFDDPFGTMRGIAEYFRDLAAEDRYFGAEPPTPDVEMLQSIAERDGRRRVEARIGETGVALRATETVEDAELTEEVSAKPAEPAPAVEAAPAATSALVEPEVTPAVSETAPLAFDDEYLMADEPEDAFIIDRDQAPVTQTPPESIAEKLRRIRAVVSRNIEPAAEMGDFDDPAPASVSAFSDTPPKRDRALSETIRSITEDIGEEDDPEEPEVEETAAPGNFFGDDIEADETLEDGTFWSDEDPAEDSGTTLATETEALHEDEAATDASESAPPLDEPTSFDDEAIADNDDLIEDDDDEADAEADPDEDKAFNAALAAALSDEDDPHETETTVEEVETEEPDHQDDAPETLTADEPIILEDSISAPESDRVVSKGLEPLSDDNGNVGRLLKETDEKFADGEGIRRRRVISQMRAAVAATKAERAFTRLITPDEQDADDQSNYRHDLDHVISKAPEIPEPAEEILAGQPAQHVREEPSAVSEEAGAKTAPLVLVSSQRVDNAPFTQAKRPSVSLADPDISDSFADWAEKMGAEELPDLLEAAAAYSAFVENQPHFSRPEIMKRVARIDPALSLSREAGLRSFGMLLRQGKIRKLQRGQFAISEETRFNPAQRIAGE